MVDLMFIISCWYFFVPAYAANMTPPLVRNLPFFRFLDVPVDFGRKLKNSRIFGAHKTWRGVAAAIITGIVVALAQRWLYHYGLMAQYSIVNYKAINIWLFAVLMALGVVLGDLIFAFIKRRFRLEPGAMFMPFDQTNYVIGCFILVEPYLKLGISVWASVFILTFFLHVLFNRLGYDLGLHKAKW